MSHVNRSTFSLAVALSLVSTLFQAPVSAQSAEELAQMEARLVARLELRLAEATEEMRSEQEATRLAFEQAVRALAKSANTLDQTALKTIAAGDVKAGLSALEERGRARDAQVLRKGNSAATTERAEEWVHIGALAFLDNTARAVEAYEHALGIAPSNPVALDQLAWLYGRQARTADRRAVAERLTRLPEADSRVRGFIHLADIHLDENDGDRAEPFVERAMSESIGAGLPKYEATAAAFLAACRVLDRRYDEAEKLVQRSLSLSRAGGFRNEEGLALFVQGTVYFARASSSLFGRKNHLQRAEDVYTQVEALFREQKDRSSIAQILIRRGHVARLMGDLTLAKQLLTDAIRILEELGVRARLGFAQQQMAATLSALGQGDDAAILFEKSVDAARETHQPAYEGSALYQWARAEAERRNRVSACVLATDAVAAWSRAAGQERQADAARALARSTCPRR